MGDGLCHPGVSFKQLMRDIPEALSAGLLKGSRAETSQLHLLTVEIACVW